MGSRGQGHCKPVKIGGHISLHHRILPSGLLAFGSGSFGLLLLCPLHSHVALNVACMQWTGGCRRAQAKPTGARLDTAPT